MFNVISFYRFEVNVDYLLYAVTNVAVYSTLVSSTNVHLSSLLMHLESILGYIYIGA